MFKVLPNTERIYEAEIECHFVTECGVTNKPFQGVITIIFHPEALYPEYCSIQDWIDSFKQKTMNHEVVARTVYDVFKSIVNCPVKVIVIAESVIHPPAICVVADTKEEREL